MVNPNPHPPDEHNGFAVATPLDWTCLVLRRVNHEMHLMQYGISRFAQNHPWVGIPVSVGGLLLLWGLYWTLLPLWLGVVGASALITVGMAIVRALRAG